MTIIIPYIHKRSRANIHEHTKMNVYWKQRMNIIHLEVKKLKTKRNLFFPSLWGMVEHQKKVTMNPTARNPFFGPRKLCAP